MPGVVNGEIACHRRGYAVRQCAEFIVPVADEYSPGIAGWRMHTGTIEGPSSAAVSVVVPVAAEYSAGIAGWRVHTGTV